MGMLNLMTVYNNRDYSYYVPYIISDNINTKVYYPSLHSFHIVHTTTCVSWLSHCCSYLLYQHGETALDDARCENNIEVVAYLEELGESVLLGVDCIVAYTDRSSPPPPPPLATCSTLIITIIITITTTTTITTSTFTTVTTTTTTIIVKLVILMYIVVRWNWGVYTTEFLC